MNSYQKLKKRIERLEEKNKEYFNDIYAIIDGDENTIKVYKEYRAMKKSIEIAIMFGRRGISNE